MFSDPTQGVHSGIWQKRQRPFVFPAKTGSFPRLFRYCQHLHPHTIKCAHFFTVIRFDINKHRHDTRQS
ncbi:hypothetical protein LHGZ1_2051 [Laribacter hongkongensis]|uniref:Uncharacterized protein n=1 Tax=Laribacter hongkongensis TaxID=168471 RepID=A0A248LJQ2_9NEIS|nr:hypothetical protein LHGZ1_2051 [Laribacter hongkongensis]